MDTIVVSHSEVRIVATLLHPVTVVIVDLKPENKAHNGLLV